MKIRFRAALEFDQLQGLAFDRFLPLAKSAIPAPLGETGFQMAICVDPDKHRGWVSDVALDALDKHYGVKVAGLYVLLDSDVEGELADVLGEGRVNAATEALGERVLEAVETIHDSLIDLVRNENQQFWLPSRRVVETSLQQRLKRYDTRWLTEEGWRLLDVAPDTAVLRGEISRNGVTPEQWSAFLETFKRGRFRSRPHRRLLANAFALHARYDLRAAIIEGVAAWEMVLSGHAVERLAERRACLDQQAWRQVIEKAGLRASSHLFFALAADLSAVGKHREEVLHAIDLRNNVIHNGQQRLEHGEIGELLRGIRQVIFACENPRTEASAG